MPQGSLTIVGSGIRSIAQLTLEAIMHIENADKVFYVVCDPATEGFIKQKNPNAVDLYEYYSNTKLRNETYIQMAEIMLREVRSGLRVVGVFYGHPGNFVSPTRRALAIAQDEGYVAKMLPGISADDCLFADLLIDPCYPGLQTVEATDVLVRDRPLQITSHVVIYQVGVICKSGFDFTSIENDKFDHFVNRLQQDYGPSHPVINYVAAVSPLAEPTIQRYTISDLFKDSVKACISGVSTFYLPPKELLPITDVGEKLILDLGTDKAALQVKTYPPLPYCPLSTGQQPYGPYEKAVIERIKDHTTPADYRPYNTSQAMYKALERLYLDPEAVKKYRRDPEGFAAAFEGLKENEAQALKSGNPDSSASLGHVRHPV
ncbi:hypothetical protein K440DRAFT_650847 [Wilcoxina mikolae CBS 423.85]|nr:hypothetical protein K440DRAFT_650847 [Wilcoxina mikolae CBS 423.85]